MASLDVPLRVAGEVRVYLRWASSLGGVNGGPGGGTDDAAGLTDAERARAARLRRPQARRQFVAARQLLRRVLAAELGCPPGEVPLAIDQYGKPYLAGRAGPAFNLSHSAGLIAVAIAMNGPVGIDVEALRTRAEPLTGAGSILAPRERQALAALPGPLRPAAFQWYWTAKEAYVKALGLGMRLAFDRFTVCPPAHGLIGRWRVQPAGPAVRIYSTDVVPGYALAVAVESR